MLLLEGLVESNSSSVLDQLSAVHPAQPACNLQYGSRRRCLALYVKLAPPTAAQDM